MYNERDETEDMRQKNSQTTCYVIAYDIPDNKRRTKVHEILLGFGTWTQYSLFECFLSKRELLILQSKLDDYLIKAKDSVRFYPFVYKLFRKGRNDRWTAAGSTCLCGLSSAARGSVVIPLSRASRMASKES